MSQLTIRKIPDEVVKQLKQTARHRGHSMNSAAVEALTRGLGLAPFPRRRRDLSAFAGGWSAQELEKFRRATAVFEAIDPEVWS
ncbi:MAG: hypothetical protein WC708_20050 [Lentisphaeria bacterium]